ncbi:GNAT family N-acetyltransferase [Trinickia terrae]|uniref:GNAT family N-acetyltransferase n=1 Tax=Trinickia terrae TaxID=2571161 RepID=UPI001F10065E|nr:GNAT family N-acetyltransferase [Trinickia terrae]
MFELPATKQKNVPTQPAYRPFTSTDVRAAHALSTSIRWPHRLEDWQFAADAGLGFVAEESGSLIGTALCWKFGADGATIGMVIVAPEQQGRGIGRNLMGLLLEELGERTTFLYATRAGQPLYEKLGFRTCGSLDQHQGTASEPPVVVLAQGERLRQVSEGDLPRLIELASLTCGLDRSAILPALLQIAEGVVLDREGEIIGFSLFRKSGRGHVIGPLVALDSADSVRARALIAYWLAAYEGVPVRIDVPAGGMLTDWLGGLGIAHVNEVTRMVRNAAAGVDDAARALPFRAYGIINQAIG